jgi:Actinobacteria/chloroflexi VLRF1 release factor
VSGPAARGIDVAPERLTGWLERFTAGHGPLSWQISPDRLTATAADGSVADCEVPFPPLRPDPNDPGAGLAAHALAERRVGVLLIRLGGYAAGIFQGSDLVRSKVGSRLVHGRNAAGGQSQRRFARRREGQVRVALAEAADVAARVLGPAAGHLDAVATGGDRRAVTTVLADPRLAALGGLVVPRLLDVPDPRLRVLLATPAQFRAVRIGVTDPSAG